MTKIMALKMRLQALWVQIGRLGGKKGRGTWLGDLAAQAKLKKLYQEKNRANKELSELLPFAQKRGAANYAPHEIAQTLDISLRLVYLTLQMYAWTGEVKFSRDYRSHQNPAKADNSVPLSEDQTDQRACNGLTPYPAPTIGIDSPSPRNPVTATVKQSIIVWRPKSCDYERTEVSDDLLPEDANIRLRPKIMSGMELVRHCYKMNVLAGIVQPLPNIDITTL